ncbi:hypothetical protein AMS68_006659 [Peltaster fructicola]|uniref:Bifunctional cytochrome P450/NADPH--P450 reductase n=1 Tax=Peltaster fructicola TaxID=286661 RepID=A0A6H0Y293_9PEZI|nr:hypothetical protein AMS68_006659 [Peltaster fructicola]
MSLPIPQPPPLPLLGNAFDVDPENSAASFDNLAAKYGPIFRLRLSGADTYVLNTVELCDEMCDEKRFHKFISAGLNEVRSGLADGLFTAYHGEHAWGVAHRTLVPAFGPLRIGEMFDEMHDLAAQLVTRWARMEGEAISVTEDYTRLTLDSIALCAMDKRFNSFYSESLHPFVTAMTDFLLESGKRARMTSVQKLLNRSGERKYEADISTMRNVAQEVINHRRAHPSDKTDLLNALLLGHDPKTGEKMTDDSIMNNMLTFLIAGHETTAGMLSSATYYLMKNPRAAQEAQKEVDQVVGRGAIRLEHMSKLPYIEAVLRETLRLQPSAPGFGVIAHDKVNPTVLAGKYVIPAGSAVRVNLRASGRDRDVFGDDAEDFKPERMYGENFTKLPRNAWKPFGNGMRGCIGRSFAWQEAVLALALILQNFHLRLDDPGYQLKLKQTLTLKPAGLFMRVSLREGVSTLGLEKQLYAGAQADSLDTSKVSKEVVVGDLKPMTVLYGSNSGTCEGLAQSLAKNAKSHGFDVKVSSMDEAIEKVSSGQPLVVVTASYEGEPTDNAKSFIEWLKSSPSAFKNVQYAVFGCGHKDWAQTYQKIPTFVDHQLEGCGGTRIAKLGATNVAEGKIFDDFDAWQDGELWPKLTDNKASSSSTEGLNVDFSISSSAGDSAYGVKEAIVVSNDVLTKKGVPEKRHIELQLPSDMTYEPGDYLAVLPTNSADVVNRVLTHFKLPWDSVMTVNSQSSFPIGRELSISNALARYVELNVPATQKNLATIAAYAPEEVKERIVSQQAGHTPSMLEVLEANPSVELPFSVYLAMLPPMRIRQYSISSSPLVNPSRASITYTVADADLKHPGVATTYLRRCESGSRIQVAVKKPNSTFRLPADKKMPLIMICAGTGLAPFRGFVQDRVTKIKAGASEFGQALLFVGCYDPDLDQLFKEEFDEAEKLGAVKVYYAYSRAPDKSNDCKFVQERLFHERAIVRELFSQNAKVYICGSSAMGNGITDAVTKMRVEVAENNGEAESLESAKKWWQGLRNDRYAVDVFA